MSRAGFSGAGAPGLEALMGPCRHRKMLLYQAKKGKNKSKGRTGLNIKAVDQDIGLVQYVGYKLTGLKREDRK